jgi:hypothetical protein
MASFTFSMHRAKSFLSLYTVKKVSDFPFTAGMSLTNLSLAVAGNN